MVGKGEGVSENDRMGESLSERALGVALAEDLGQTACRRGGRAFVPSDRVRADIIPAHAEAGEEWNRDDRLFGRWRAGRLRRDGRSWPRPGFPSRDGHAAGRAHIAILGLLWPSASKICTRADGRKSRFGQTDLAGRREDLNQNPLRSHRGSRATASFGAGARRGRGHLVPLEGAVSDGVISCQ